MYPHVYGSLGIFSRIGFHQLARSGSDGLRQKVETLSDSIFDTGQVACTYDLRGDVGGEPVEALEETLAGGGAGGLDVPLAVAEGVEAELVGDLGHGHGVGQILCRETPVDVERESVNENKPTVGRASMGICVRGASAGSRRTCLLANTRTMASRSSSSESMRWSSS